MSAGCKAAVDTWGLDYYFFKKFFKLFLSIILMCRLKDFYRAHVSIYYDVTNPQAYLREPAKHLSAGKKSVVALFEKGWTQTQQWKAP